MTAVDTIPIPTPMTNPSGPCSGLEKRGDQSQLPFSAREGALLCEPEDHWSAVGRHGSGTDGVSANAQKAALTVHSGRRAFLQNEVLPPPAHFVPSAVMAPPPGHRLSLGGDWRA